MALPTNKMRVICTCLQFTNELPTRNQQFTNKLPTSYQQVTNKLPKYLTSNEMSEKSWTSMVRAPMRVLPVTYDKLKL